MVGSGALDSWGRITCHPVTRPSQFNDDDVDKDDDEDDDDDDSL